MYDEYPKCALCGSNVKIAGYLCKGCANDPLQAKRKMKVSIFIKQGRNCIVSGCPWKSKSTYGKGLHIHRINPGKCGGSYTEENCVLVCPHHHKMIEGLSREEIDKYKTELRHTANMDIRHTSEYISDVPSEDIRRWIEDIFEHFLVKKDKKKINKCISILSEMDNL